jgi:hypothetical protein
MFNICNNENTGFHITFENGWTVSVQWKKDNSRAETACWFQDGPTSEVTTYCTPEDVAKTIMDVSTR